MDEIRELLARLAELTADELAHLQELCSTEFDRLDGEARTPDNVAAMADVVTAAESARAEVTARETAQAEAEQQAEELRTRMHAVSSDEDEEDAGEEAAPDAGDGGGDEESEGEAGAESDDAEALAASARPGSRVERMANVRRGQARPSPEAAGAGAPVSALIAASTTGAYGGQPIEDIHQLGEIMSETLSRLGRGGPESALVASARWHYPEDRVLDGDADSNTARILASMELEALAASGGICAPVNIDYSVPVWAVADRPLKDGLNQFEVSRGGLQFVTPPDIGGLSGATAVWTEATDASPGSSTKPVLTVACGSTQTLYVNAIPTRLQFGNMQSRFAPEQIAANTELAMAAAARIAEVELLSLISGSCKLISAAQVLGATRDLLATVDKIVASYKDIHRLSDNQMLTAIFPRWARDLIRADMVRELANGGTVDIDPFAVTDAQIDAWFALRKVKVIWTLDGLPAVTSGSIQYPTQNFVAEVTETAEVLWPTKVVWELFVEGTFQFLDGGRLDLGVVRDATLDSTNDYETFIEPFEGIAFRGVEALQIVSSVQPTGGSSGTVAVATSGL